MIDEQPIAIDRTNSQHRRRWQIAIAGSLLAFTLLGLGLAQAQQNNRAGIVIQFGDGSVTTACVDLAEADTNSDGATTGDEVLRAVKLPVVVEASALGPAVCKVGNEGCDFPSSDCFCQCTLAPGSDCRYWSYNRLQNNQWVFSGRGAGNTVVRAGDVEGWIWGVGTINAGAQPQVRSFSQLCAAQAATVTASPSPSVTSSPVNVTLTPTLPDVLLPQVMHQLPTWTPSPSASATTTRSATATRSATTTSAAGSVPAATATGTTAAQPSATAQPAATNSGSQQDASTPAAPDRSPTSADAPPATALPAQNTMVMPTSLSPTTETASTGAPAYPPAPSAPPIAPAYPPAPDNATSSPPTDETVASDDAPTSTLSVAQPTTRRPSTAATTTVGPTPTASTAQSRGAYRQYVVFIALVGLLAAGWFAVRRWRSGNA